MTVCELTEYRPKPFCAEELPLDIVDLIWRRHATKITVDFPSPKTENRAQLTSEGWVGYLPLTAEFALRLVPKVEIGNVFRMLEYAYELPKFETQSLMQCGSLEEFFDSLARILALQVLKRNRKGLYRSYVEHAEDSLFLRGRLDLRRTVRTPASLKFHCNYEEHTADLEDNQILAWTLYCVARSCAAAHSLSAVRQAYRALAGHVSLLPVRTGACMNRVYNRLNDDYRTMHALSSFFLNHLGPVHTAGENQMLPFLVDMASVYELFVARWLLAHPIPGLTLKQQVGWSVGASEELRYRIDLVLFDSATGQPVCVLDTKYKAHGAALPADVNQVTTYALGQGCRDAVLVYPAPLASTLDDKIGDIRVRSLTFGLDGDLEKNGREFRERLVGGLASEALEGST